MPACPCCGSEVSRPEVYVSVDYNSVFVGWSDHPAVKLRPRNAEILSLLVAKMPFVVDRRFIIERVWGTIDGGCDLKALDTHIWNLRQQLKPFSDLIIENVHSRGYRLYRRGYDVGESLTDRVSVSAAEGPFLYGGGRA